MNTQTDQQFRLAAEILETGAEFEYRSASGWMPPARDRGANFYVCSGFEIRLKEAAPEPEWVPLEASDVPPGSAVKAATDGPTWGMVLAVDTEGVYVVGNVFNSFAYLFKTNWLILRPGATEWEPCRKLKGKESA